MKILYNNKWELYKPNISIITPVYNRRKELPRAISSVKKQTYQDFEHIIVNDGSIELIDDIVIEYMEGANYPVAFVSKSNGGVHTARNAGIKSSRGRYILFLDSDDELKMDCLELFVQAWQSIPEKNRNEYWEVTAFCEDQKGNRLGGHLPQNINLLPFPKARELSLAVETGDKVGLIRGDLIRDHLWAEPENVTFVTENANWFYFESKYKSWYLDNVVLVYHQETEVSYTKIRRKKSDQQVINQLYNHLWYINNGGFYGLSFKCLFLSILRYTTLKHVLCIRKVKFQSKWYKHGVNSYKVKLIISLIWFPSIILALIYNLRHS